MGEEFKPEQADELSERNQEMMGISPEQKGRNFLDGKKELRDKINAGMAVMVAGAMASAGLMIGGTIEATVLASAFTKEPTVQWLLGVGGTAQMLASLFGMGIVLKGMRMQTEARSEDNLPKGEK